MDGGFTYDTEVDAGTGIKAIARFLQDKEGFCVHFSFTMAAMARTLGIPARVAVGFTPGTPQPDGTMSVGLRDAHAWPELYFEGVGWTRFEPTPGRGSVPDYTRQDTPSGGPTDSQLPHSSTSAAPSAGPSSSASCDALAKKLQECAGAAAGGAAPPADPGTPAWAVALLVTGSVVVLLLLLLLPLLWRLRVRARRLGAGGHASPALLEPATEEWRETTATGGRGRAGPPTTEATASRTLAAWRELTDTAWDHGITPDDSQTPRGAAARIVRLGRLDQASADAVHRVADAVEQVLYAPVPRPATGLAEDTRRVRAGCTPRPTAGQDCAHFWRLVRPFG